MNSNCPDRVFPVPNRILEHQHQIQYTQISLNTKFHFKQTILTFCGQFAGKGSFVSKAVQVNVTIKFNMFYLLSVKPFILRK